jgi:hypothetical protein
MKKTLILLLPVFLIGCSTVSIKTKKENCEIVTAQFANKAVKIDGILDDAIWKQAPVYQLQLVKSKTRKGEKVNEPAEVRFAWDENYFYAGVKLFDSDIVAEGKQNQMHHFDLGDVCEMFLKPENETWYWELYTTPAGKKSSLFILGLGRVGLPSTFNYKSELDVAAKCHGTLNNGIDKDKYWIAEMAMPVKNLTERGDKFGPGSEWRVMVSRYNYGRYSNHRGAELSSIPQLSSENFHLLKEFAKIRFRR